MHRLKAQVSIEFLLGFSIYLVFLLLIYSYLSSLRDSEQTFASALTDKSSENSEALFLDYSYIYGISDTSNKYLVHTGGYVTSSGVFSKTIYGVGNDK